VGSTPQAAAQPPEKSVPAAKPRLVKE